MQRLAVEVGCFTSIFLGAVSKSKAELLEDCVRKGEIFAHFEIPNQTFDDMFGV